jgi:hypothetical protein
MNAHGDHIMTQANHINFVSWPIPFKRINRLFNSIFTLVRIEHQRILTNVQPI